MTISATVYCTCYCDGRAQPFPIPELESYFQCDGVMRPGLALPYDDTTLEAHRIVDVWMQQACEHPGMVACAVEVPDNQYFGFYEVLAHIGWNDFPSLYQHLPPNTTGYLPAQDVVGALHELRAFNHMSEFDHTIQLVAADTNTVIWEHMGRWVNQIEMQGVYFDMGIDEQGFYVTLAHAPHESVFRAVWFEQQVADSGQQVYFHNLETGEQFMSPMPIDVRFSADGQLDFPRQLVVRSQVRTPADFADVVRPLMLACEAALATGNPILWG